MSQTERTRRYRAKNARIGIVCSKAAKEELQKKADRKGKSLTAYMVQAGIEWEGECEQSKK